MHPGLAGSNTSAAAVFVAASLTEARLSSRVFFNPLNLKDFDLTLSNEPLEYLLILRLNSGSFPSSSRDFFFERFRTALLEELMVIIMIISRVYVPKFKTRTTRDEYLEDIKFYYLIVIRVNLFHLLIMM